MKPAPHTFHEMLIQSRVDAGHTVDSLAVLLGMDPEGYEALEAGRYPDDETLRRICRLMDWNYYEAQRLIINEMISPHPHQIATAPPPRQEAAGGEHAPALPPRQPREPMHPGPFLHDTLAGRLRAAREETGQSKAIIAMMLRLEEAHYEALEAGQAPSDELLRRISVLYNWNYRELVDLLRAEQAGSFYPHLRTPPFPGATARAGRYRKLVEEMYELFTRLPDADQRMILSQLELVRDTMRRHRRTGT